MSTYSHDDLQDLLPAYALGILEAAEAEVVGRHMATCAACRAELAAYTQVADDLALAAPDADPDAALKQQLFARIQEKEETAVAPQKTAERPSVWAAIQSWLAGLRWQPIAAALALLVVISGALLWQQWQQAEALPGRQLALTPTDVAPEARGVIHISENGRWGTLIVEDLPPLAPDQQYQLWLIKDGERVSGGVFSVPNHGYFSLGIDSPDSLNDYSAFGITIEPFGGSPGPTGDRVLGFNL